VVSVTKSALVEVKIGGMEEPLPAVACRMAASAAGLWNMSPSNTCARAAAAAQGPDGTTGHQRRWDVDDSEDEL
jgi:hypothetical protein